MRDSATASLPAPPWLGAIIEATPDFVGVGTADGRVLYLNPAGLRLLGLPEPTDVATLALGALMPRWVAERMNREWLPAAQRDGTVAGEGALLTADGVEIPVDFVLITHPQESGSPLVFSTIARDLRERHRVEAALRASDDRFVKAFAVSPLALSFTSLATGRLVEVNDAFVRMTGYTRDEAIGHSTSELGMWLSAEERAALVNAAKAGDTRGRECRFLRKDGSELIGLASVEWLDVHGEPCVLTVLEDITLRKQAEAALRLSEDRFRLAAEAVNGIIYDYDLASGRVERTRGLREVLGYAPEEAAPTARWWVQQMHPEDRERVIGAITGLASSRESTLALEYRMRHKDGRWRHMLDRAVLQRGPDGHAARQVGCMQDITELREAERALRETDRRKDQFLAMLAHELRNPLAPIRTAVEVLRTLGPAEPPLEQMRAIIERQVTHLARLVDDLLEVARITEHKIALRKDTLDLTTIVARAVETSRPLIDERHHRLTVTLPPEPLRLEGDLTRLAQVVGNLLNNAAKYTAQGGHIALAATVEAGTVVITVTDDGIGIAADVLPHVFDLFMQADQSLDRSEGGLGIGLTLVRSLVELHGGAVEAHSDGPGRGSAFRVRLPLAPAPASERGTEHGERPVDQIDTTMPASPAAAVTGEAEGAKEAGAPSYAGAQSSFDTARAPSSVAAPARRVLIVDDNVDAAESLALLLDFGAHQTAVAHTGAAALQLAEEFGPDAVLLDIGLPGMDGYEVARRLRQLPLPHAPLIVALTGYGRAEDRQRSLEAGCDEHLTKPVEPAEIEGLLSRGQK